ncbi:MAG: hypothetical protein ACRD8Z_02685, partial [Nitrososphaeraceae archaeon]
DYTHEKIAEKLKCSRPIITLDIRVMKATAREQISEYTHEIFPLEVKNQVKGLDNLIRKNYDMIEKNPDDPRVLHTGSSVIQQLYKDKMDMITGTNTMHKLILVISFVRKV